MSQTWNEQLQEALIQRHGNKPGQLLSQKYLNAFPIGYTDEYGIDIALGDIAYIENLSAEKPLDSCFYLTSAAAEYPTHLRLYQWEKPIALSDLLPMLENLDLRVYSERSNKITLSNQQIIFISDLPCL